MKNELEASRNELDEKVKVLREESSNAREALLYLNMGDRLLTQNETSEAVKYYEEARKRLPDDINISYIVGRVYSNLGDADAAIDAFEGALAQEAASRTRNRERRAEMLKELGLAYRRRGTANHGDADMDLAMKYLKEAISLNTKDADAYAILGGL